MNYKTPEYLAKEYLFDLNNIAHEYGFKAGESWKIGLATAAEKAAIEKNYHPVISTKVSPEFLPQLYRIVKATFGQALNSAESAMNAKSLIQSALYYVVAHNPGRPRR
ncbi:hypothetical protein [Mucilaginibacter sp. UR6-11]|uniref:hypothetical protein n=1 Tax=Mucilaginibacter sp. UR6-11 TaxID=1435644 RepID=UPI001E39199F|nr:hypothetical protein [Mucilaginibacter sp. UR6-11]MCC8426497.1 hypothetical protein [Mucilaginibacter sp. UR6-11]